MRDLRNRVIDDREIGSSGDSDQNPSSADAHFLCADYLHSFKRNAEWDREIQQALALDPVNGFLRCFYGWHLICVGRYDEAIAVLERVAVAQPNFSSVHMALWGAY